MLVREGDKPGSVSARAYALGSHGHLSGMNVAIHLGATILGVVERAALLHCRVLHRMGFTSAGCFQAAWCALTAPFHPDRASRMVPVNRRGGLVSVALSVGFAPSRWVNLPSSVCSPPSR